MKMIVALLPLWSLLDYMIFVCDFVNNSNIFLLVVFLFFFLKHMTGLALNVQ